MTFPTHNMISERVADLDEQIRLQDLVIKALRDERGELLVALKVIKRFSNEPIDTIIQNEDARKNLATSLLADTATEQREREAQKAAGRKTTPEMIMDILAACDAMSPKDLLVEVRKRYWPEAPATSVGPTAWRMWKDGRLTKGENGYSLPNEKGPAVTAADPLERSETGGNGSLF